MRSIQSLGALIVTFLFPTMALAKDIKAPEWLFVHTSQTAEMTRDITLVMPVARDIFAFTDRPHRLHSYMNAYEFVSMWEGEGDTFRGDPPSAVLTLVDGENVKEAEVVVANAIVTHNGESISYEVVFEAGDHLQSRMGKVSFFIDGFKAPKRLTNQSG